MVNVCDPEDDRRNEKECFEAHFSGFLCEEKQGEGCGAEEKFLGDGPDDEVAVGG